jgi:hypothetical protein
MNSRIFRRAAKNEELVTVEGSAPFEMEKEIARGVKAGNVGALANLGTFSLQIGKKKMMIKKLDRLAP